MLTFKWGHFYVVADWKQILCLTYSADRSTSVRTDDSQRMQSGISWKLVVLTWAAGRTNTHGNQRILITWQEAIYTSQHGVHRVQWKWVFLKLCVRNHTDQSLIQILMKKHWQLKSSSSVLHWEHQIHEAGLYHTRWDPRCRLCKEAT